MMAAAFDVALTALLASITTLQLFSSLEHHLAGGMTTAQAVQALLPLAAMGTLLAGLASIHGQLRRAAAAAAGAGMEVAAAFTFATVGLLLQLFVCKPAAEVEDYGARARELGTAAARFLPASATATFFLGMALLFARVRAGDGGAVAEEGIVQILVKKIVLMATAVLVGLMALALAF